MEMNIVSSVFVCIFYTMINLSILIGLIVAIIANHEQ